MSAEKSWSSYSGSAKSTPDRLCSSTSGIEPVMRVDAGGIAFEPTSTGSGGTEALVFTSTPRGFLRITVMMSSW